MTKIASDPFGAIATFSDSFSWSIIMRSMLESSIQRGCIQYMVMLKGKVSRIDTRFFACVETVSVSRGSFVGN
jgi:hypothetical protein